jgi:hypothetical protein
LAELADEAVMARSAEVLGWPIRMPVTLSLEQLSHDYGKLHEQQGIQTVEFAAPLPPPARSRRSCVPHHVVVTDTSIQWAS